MTINNSQGQTFKAVGVDLTNESSTHGMLYAELSRVGSPECLTMLVREECKTHNDIYNEIFNWLYFFALHCLSADLCVILRVRSVVRIIMYIHISYFHSFR